MGRIIPYIMENKKCLKPPTRWYNPLINPRYVQHWVIYVGQMLGFIFHHGLHLGIEYPQLSRDTNENIRED